MLSSIAEKIYWLSRYIERVENTSRLINVNSDLLLDIPHDESNDLKHLIQITGHIENFKKPNYCDIIGSILYDQNLFKIDFLANQSKTSKKRGISSFFTWLDQYI